MWYKYIDRVGYESLRTFRYPSPNLGAATSNSTRTTTACLRPNTPDSSSSTSSRPPGQKDPYNTLYPDQRLSFLHLCFLFQCLLLVLRRAGKSAGPHQS